jgi:hypothetical protein
MKSVKPCGPKESIPTTGRRCRIDLVRWEFSLLTAPRVGLRWLRIGRAAELFHCSAWVTIENPDTQVWNGTGLCKIDHVERIRGTYFCAVPE